MSHQTLLQSFVSLMVMVLITITSENVSGQIGVSVRGDHVTLSGFGDVDLEKTIEFWSTNQKDDIIERMDLQVSQIVDVCKITDAEAKMLRFAAKGLVNHRISIGTQQISEFSARSGLIESESDSSEEFSDQDKLNFYGASPRPDGVVELKTWFSTPLTAHAIWQNALKKNLTEDQFGEYNRFRIAGNQRLMELAIELWISELELQVFLLPHQSTEFKTQMHAHFDGKITSISPATLKQARKFVADEFGSRSAPLQELLNEKQTARRKEVLNPIRGGSSVGWAAGPDR